MAVAGREKVIGRHYSPKARAANENLPGPCLFLSRCYNREFVARNWQRPFRCFRSRQATGGMSQNEYIPRKGE